MSDWPNNPNEFAESIAVVGRDERGALVVTACNDAFFQMTGAAHADKPTFPIPFDALVPESARLALREKLDECLTSGGARTCDFRDGAQRWRVSLKPAACANDATVFVTGFPIAPATSQTREPDVSASRYRAVVDSAYDAIVAIDQRHHITLFNRAAQNLFGYTAAEVLGRPVEMLLPEQFRAHHARNVQQFADSTLTELRQTTPPRMDESNSVYGQHRDGSIIPVEIAIAKIDVNGVTEFTAVVRDITDRARQMELLKKQAVTDALTGLPNRREFLAFIDNVLGTDDVLSVFILDIDFFKNINDSHGHDAGDEVLRVLAKVGMSMTHEANLFARWGGEEFVAALPGADAGLAHTIAETLRRRIEQQDFAHEWHLKPIPFTVSIGVVTRDAGERDVDTLMKRADRALYRAKQSGRNRVEVG
ncbi:PAS domain S-box-containing protein/diguanylate cyclase (GGDEF)-like protein [Paraburkholderia caballeronis]|uniref:sensor domain-containing diguanylate cyclase n=1 Tax=Paraburkholderia caballeronis TaxID=416943 RepID=UPI00106545EE|nr:diguanylate cyclase [Paraburkholderia caballeronis]TDV32705.1 PAS domain S-box-containing protein/diguanylate cyclase (GGDEF)-like protein [Paraburkholderia caballeronis]